MNIVEQLPVLLLVIPLLTALVISLTGVFSQRSAFPLTVISTGLVLVIAAWTLARVTTDGVIHYRLGGWPPPFGIEYVVDHLNALVLVVIAFVGFLAAIYSKQHVVEEMPAKISQFYTLYVLLITGLLGITITGDAFNLYVLLEISALTSYALIAIGKDRALLSSFNYLIMGTIGACFYLLGVGHLYIMGGSLNMPDLQGILVNLYGTDAIQVAFVLILVGVWVKMAFFPVHGWLPNAYTYAPSATSCMMAPLMTKVSVYVMIRVMFSVYSPSFTFETFAMHTEIVWLAVAAILGGSLLALAQTNFKKMLTYLIVAEVGYMVGGVWLANRLGITGAVLHIVNDALMTLCLFFVAGIVLFKVKGCRFEDLRGLFRTMPFTMAAFTVAALSMIGVPPTCGFFSKYYLIMGAIEAGEWVYMGALIVSSLVNAVLFFRVIELAFFDAPRGEPVVAAAVGQGGQAPAAPEDHGGPAEADRDAAGEHGGHGHDEQVVEPIDEAPPSMLVPLIVVAAALIVVGLCTGEIVDSIVQFTVPAGLP